MGVAPPSCKSPGTADRTEHYRTWVTSIKQECTDKRSGGKVRGFPSRTEHATRLHVENDADTVTKRTTAPAKSLARPSSEIHTQHSCVLAILICLYSAMTNRMTITSRTV